MEKFKLTDHIHYDRNDPSQPQSIYFDVDPSFYPRLNDVIGRVEDGLNRDRVEDVTIALGRITKALTTEFGEFTLGELLCVAHYVSSMLTANTAEHVGFQKGVQSVVDTMNRFNPFSDWGKMSGIA